MTAVGSRSVVSRVALAVAFVTALCIGGRATAAESTRVAQAAPGVIIRDVTLISPEREAPLEHAYVRIQNGRIAEVSTQPLKGKEEIDGRGRFLVPGLIDSHMHLGWVPGMAPPHLAEHPRLVAAARAQEPRSYLYFGFTTVLSLGTTAAPIKQWNALDIRPDAYFCGKTPMARGYSFDSFSEDPYFLFNPDQEASIPATINRAEHTPEAVIARMAADGAICVKSYYEPGFGRVRNLPVPTPAMARAVVEAAHKRNLPVFMHANSKPAQAFAAEVGVDVIAHGMWNGHRLRDGALEPDVHALAQKIIQRGMGYQPTSQVIRGLGDLFDDSYLSNPLLTHAYPAAQIAWYRTNEGKWFRNEELGVDSGEVFDGVSELGDAVVRYLAANNARLLFGTDTPSSPTYANPPGLNGFLEMRGWVAAGVSLKQLLRAATLENARIMKLDGQIGSIEKGKIAHLLLLRANPLQSVEAYNSIETVFLAGRPIARHSLSARAAPAR